MTGFIYAIRCMDRVKIGFSTDPILRFNKVQSDNAEPCRLLGVIAGDLDLEAELHSRFSEYHIRGEWFHLKGAVAEFVCTMDEPFTKRQAESLADLMCADDGFDVVEWMKAVSGRQKIISDFTGITQSKISQICNDRLPLTKGTEARIRAAILAAAGPKTQANA